jgi:hypothetical protein
MKNGEQFSSNKQMILSGILLLGGAYLAWTLGRSFFEQARKTQAMNLADQSQEVRQAMNLRTAMNPIGISWLRWMDGTNSGIINEISREIKDLDKVLKAYRNLYQSELLLDLQSELGAKEFRAFLENIAQSKNTATNSSASTSSNYTLPLNLIVAKQAVSLRSSPDATNHGAWYEMASKNNILRTAQSGEFIGYSSGKQHYDQKNQVKFIEVAYRNSATQQSTTLWVSASSNYTDQFTSVDAMEAKYPKLKGIIQIIQPPYGPVSLSFPGTLALSLCDMELLDREFKSAARIKAHQVLGKPQMRLKGKGTDLTLIKTFQGQNYWCATENLMFQ